jgi:hypothetical protein
MHDILNGFESWTSAHRPVWSTWQTLLDSSQRYLVAPVEGIAPLVLLMLGAALLMRAWRAARSPWGMAAIGMAGNLIVARDGMAAAFLAVIASTYACVRLTDVWLRNRRDADGARWRIAVTTMAALIAAFAFCRLVPDLSQLPHNGSVVLLGISMLVCLQLVSFLWEYGGGRIACPTVPEYLAWCGLPFTRFGTIVRYSDFARQLECWREPLPALPATWLRSLTDAAGKLVLAAGCAAASDNLATAGTVGRVINLYSAQPWGYYLGVAGLADIALLFGQLGGVAIPRNYDRPFEKTNLGEFWGSWNISCTRIFREMLFYNRWGLQRANLYFNSLILFLMVGLWHDVNAYWLTWGLMHGAGFCIFLWWRGRQKSGARPLPRVLAWGLTYAFVCSCWAFPPQIVKLAQRLADAGLSLL